jgi:response regulator RpfG family c-di-GMP phosphodiesterase
MMPKKTGSEVVDALQKDSWGQNVPIIFLTNVSDPDQVSEISAASRGNSTVFDYLIKSDWKLEDVMKKVRQKLKIG